MSRRRSFVLREILVFLGVCVVLAGVALIGQRLLVARPPDVSGIADRLDQGLGSLVREQLRASQKLIEPPRAAKGLDLIARRLRDVLPEPRPPIHILIVDSPEINAFTIPGDTICVTTALIRVLPSADEMAGVMGHELSHALNRDPLHALERQLGVAALLSAVSGGRGGGVLTNMAQTMVDMRYGREAEDRADAFSVDLLARAGIAPSSYAAALEHIRDAAPKEPELLKYLDPHSPIGQRIERARSLAQKTSFTRRPLGINWNALVGALPGK